MERKIIGQSFNCYWSTVVKISSTCEFMKIYKNIVSAFLLSECKFVVIPFDSRRKMEVLQVCFHIKIDTNGDMLSRPEGNLLGAITLFVRRDTDWPKSPQKYSPQNTNPSQVGDNKVFKSSFFNLKIHTPSCIVHNVWKYLMFFKEIFDMFHIFPRNICRHFHS